MLKLVAVVTVVSTRPSFATSCSVADYGSGMLCSIFVIYSDVCLILKKKIELNVSTVPCFQRLWQHDPLPTAVAVHFLRRTKGVSCPKDLPCWRQQEATIFGMPFCPTVLCIVSNLFLCPTSFLSSFASLQTCQPSASCRLRIAMLDHRQPLTF